jgi:hypothetical protein
MPASQCNSRHVSAPRSAAETEWLETGDEPMDIPWLTGLSSERGNHWLRLPAKVVSQNLIKNRATHAAPVSY